MAHCFIHFSSCAGRDGTASGCFIFDQEHDPMPNGIPSNSFSGIPPIFIAGNPSLANVAGGLSGGNALPDNTIAFLVPAPMVPVVPQIGTPQFTSPGAPLLPNPDQPLSTSVFNQVEDTLREMGPETIRNQFNSLVARARISPDGQAAMLIYPKDGYLPVYLIYDRNTGTTKLSNKPTLSTALPVPGSERNFLSLLQIAQNHSFPPPSDIAYGDQPSLKEALQNGGKVSAFPQTGPVVGPPPPPTTTPITPQPPVTTTTPVSIPVATPVPVARPVTTTYVATFDLATDKGVKTFTIENSVENGVSNYFGVAPDGKRIRLAGARSLEEASQQVKDEIKKPNNPLGVNAPAGPPKAEPRPVLTVYRVVGEATMKVDTPNGERTVTIYHMQPYNLFDGQDNGRPFYQIPIGGGSIRMQAVPGQGLAAAGQEFNTRRANGEFPGFQPPAATSPNPTPVTVTPPVRAPVPDTAIDPNAPIAGIENVLRAVGLVNPTAIAIRGKDTYEITYMGPGGVAKADISVPPGTTSHGVLAQLGLSPNGTPVGVNAIPGQPNPNPPSTNPLPTLPKSPMGVPGGSGTPAEEAAKYGLSEGDVLARMQRTGQTAAQAAASIAGEILAGGTGGAPSATSSVPLKFTNEKGESVNANVKPDGNGGYKVEITKDGKTTTYSLPGAATYEQAVGQVMDSAVSPNGLPGLPQNQGTAPENRRITVTNTANSATKTVKPQTTTQLPDAALPNGTASIKDTAFAAPPSVNGMPPGYRRITEGTLDEVKMRELGPNYIQINANTWHSRNGAIKILFYEKNYKTILSHFGLFNTYSNSC